MIGRIWETEIERKTGRKGRCVDRAGFGRVGGADREGWIKDLARV